MGKQRRHRDTIEGTVIKETKKEENEMAEEIKEVKEEAKETQQATPETTAPEPKKRGFLGKIWDATGGRAKRAWDNAPTPAKVIVGGLGAAAVFGVVYWLSGGGSDDSDSAYEPPMLEDNDNDSDDVIDVSFQTVEEPVEAEIEE